ncbi:hypothetical protein [Lysinibacillus fusiformis]|uniref:hypothetical protein n=1 Tax=Lysinibacillus fusiformis TaxID=28031 RepID=UPI003D063B72
MNDIVVFQPKYFPKLSLIKLAKARSGNLQLSIVCRASKVQLLAIEDIKNRWGLTKTSTAPFLRQVDSNVIQYTHIEAEEKNIALFTLTALEVMDQLATKIDDLASPTLQLIVVRFDGTIGNKTGAFLIELPTDYIPEYIDLMKFMKSFNVNEKLSLNSLLDFYADTTDSPFKDFNLDEFRHLYLPRTENSDEDNND